jgi:hypothetical protein
VLDLTLAAMSTDYAEKEREFIGGLSEDTGRDLAQWMAAISASGHSERNAIIDWLRHQGFQFAKASWLERIHHNGGRLIYGGGVERRREPAQASAAAANVPNDAPPKRGPVSAPRPSASSPLDDDIKRLLAEAKGLRPLAEHVLRETARAIPEVEFGATSQFVMMSAPFPFAALLPGPKKLRLYANFGAAGGGRIKAAETVNKSAPPFAQMLLLDDARSIDEEFVRMMRAAAGA